MRAFPPPFVARRRLGRWPAALGLLAVLVLGGCAALLRTPPEPPPAAAPAHWPAGVLVRDGSLRSASGCLVTWRLYQPAAPTTAALVVLSHGFLRSPARMRDLAVALASAGIPTVTPALCNMRPWRGGHRQNAADLRALAQALAAPRVVYAGFSAGALAALLAAAADPKTLGVLALDLVDAGGLGARAAAGLQRPLLGLSGEPTNCNAGDNGRAVFAAHPHGQWRRVAGAGHCDFESPTDRLCERVCTDPDPAGPSQRDAIIATAVTLVQGLLASDGPPWSGPGPILSARSSARNDRARSMSP